jgi:D-alanine-D-alanine ligase
MKTVAVFFGGRSTEHDVSIVTAIASVIKPLELTRNYQVEPVYIARDGSWYSDARLKDITVYTSGKIDSLVRQLKPIAVQFDGGLTLLKPAGLGKTKRIRVDVAFPAMHGTYGEDGTLMGVLELAGVPYVGCDMPSSVLAMDKVLAKVMVQSKGILTPKFHYYDRAAISSDLPGVITAATKDLKFPLFVKPAHLGSSIGISRAANRTELSNALEVAAHYDDKIIVEEAVQNLIEVTLPVMGNDEPVPALLERPMTTAEDFFDFETKYMHGGKKGGKAGGSKGAQGYSQLPAELPGDLYKKAESTGLAVYAALGCSGIARVDMLIDSKSGEVYFNEVNPLPGSLYAHNWRIAGVAGVDLVNRLIEYAEERFATKQELTTTFGTSYLKQF